MKTQKPAPAWFAFGLNSCRLWPWELHPAGSCPTNHAGGQDCGHALIGSSWRLSFLTGSQSSASRRAALILYKPDAAFPHPSAGKRGPPPVSTGFPSVLPSRSCPGALLAGFVLEEGGRGEDGCCLLSPCCAQERLRKQRPVITSSSASLDRWDGKRPPLPPHRLLWAERQQAPDSASG